MSDLLNTKEIEVTEPKHLRMIFETLAFMTAAEMLKDLADKTKLSGTGYAHAVIEAEAQKQRANMIAQNMRICSKAGIDFDNGQMTIDIRSGHFFIRVCESAEGKGPE